MILPNCSLRQELKRSVHQPSLHHNNPDLKLTLRSKAIETSYLLILSQPSPVLAEVQTRTGRRIISEMSLQSSTTDGFTSDHRYTVS